MNHVLRRIRGRRRSGVGAGLVGRRHDPRLDAERAEPAGTPAAGRASSHRPLALHTSSRGCVAVARGVRTPQRPEKALARGRTRHQAEGQRWQAGHQGGRRLGRGCGFPSSRGGMAWLALKLSRVSWFLSDTGIRCAMWRETFAPWSGVAAIEFHRTGFGQFWILAPGVVTVNGKAAPRRGIALSCRAGPSRPRRTPCTLNSRNTSAPDSPGSTDGPQRVSDR